MLVVLMCVPQGALAEMAAGTAKQRKIINKAAKKYGIKPSILYGVWGAETNFSQNLSTSSAGAQGPFQFMPGTAAGMGVDPHNFKSAAFGAADYLSQYKGRGRKGMLGAYNAGPAGNINNSETQAYIPRVIELAKGWPGAKGGGKVKQGGKTGKREPDDLVLKKGKKGEFDAEGFREATGKQFLAQFIEKKNPESPLLTAGLFSTAPVEREDYVTPSKPGKLVNKKGKKIKGPDAAKGADGAPGVAKGGHIKGGSYPLGATGDLIGTPGVGTHTLGNWQSDNAVDLGVPEGTPVRAVVDGEIGSQIGSLGSGGQFAGLRVYVNGGGNSYYYAHLSKLAVKAGQKVKKGDIIGYSGSANGVAHLHLASQNGDPRDLIGGGAPKGKKKGKKK